MDKLELAMELIRRVQNDQKRMEAMNKELEKAGGGWAKRIEIEKKYYPIPRKTVINNSLKMARRLISEAYV